MGIYNVTKKEDWNKSVKINKEHGIYIPSANSDVYSISIDKSYSAGILHISHEMNLHFDFRNRKIHFLSGDEIGPEYVEYSSDDWDYIKERYPGLEDECYLQIKDYQLEKLWEELEDIPFVTNSEGVLVLDTEKAWNGFKPGTSREKIWQYFDNNHTKGVAYLVNEYEPDKTKPLSIICYEENDEIFKSTDYYNIWNTSWRIIREYFKENEDRVLKKSDNIDYSNFNIDKFFTNSKKPFCQEAYVLCYLKKYFDEKLKETLYQPIKIQFDANLKAVGCKQIGPLSENRSDAVSNIFRDINKEPVENSIESGVKILSVNNINLTYHLLEISKYPEGNISKSTDRQQIEHSVLLSYLDKIKKPCMEYNLHKIEDVLHVAKNKIEAYTDTEKEIIERAFFTEGLCDQKKLESYFYKNINQKNKNQQSKKINNDCELGR
ncbi:MAG: hypothetical protein IKN54_01250 [Lachnospiraceae bacterium]|nr:hypothetical protein [Lachnospiraceae bacterium]